ncbi:MAG: TonB-dependent receptor [Bacteroidia bacterium]|nr:TonB-dependent receptor [Bacteroidia bacterium]MDW8302512.1 TonB-dependent receptor [Bacteroidia bacterium]
MYWYISFAQEKFTVSGKIKDASTGEVLIGVTVMDKNSQEGLTSNEYGFYSIRLSKGKHTLVFRLIGYQTIEKEVDVQSNLTLNIDLAQEDITTNEVVVTDVKGDENVKSTEMSNIRLDISQVKTMPALLGEVDIIKILQFLPGVQSAGEGLSGFFVRGGNFDQNLVLLDEAVVFNASHLLGFFSVFNSDAVKDMTLIKGGMPAQYGGRLSSVVDIKMNEGNNKKFGVKGGIGLLSSRATVEGPLKKEKGSFIVSARRSYADVFLKFARNRNLRDNQLYFYDANLKANYEFSQKDRLFLSGYFGRDIFNFTQLFSQFWGNSTATLRWNHIYNGKLFSNVSLIYSDFFYGFGSQFTGEEFKYRSGIRNLNLKVDYDYFLNNQHKVKFGVHGIYYTFLNGEIESEPGSFLNDYKLRPSYAREIGIYINDEFTITNRLSVQYGVRYSGFDIIGPSQVFVFPDKSYERPTDTIEYARGRSIKYYGGFEPRASMCYILNEKSSIKASYARTRQYIHLASNATASLPTDIWLPSTKYITPQIADQYAAGYFRNFLDNEIETSVEIYYKDMQNQVDFKDNSNTFLNPYIEQEVYQGRGWSYGVELFVRKNTGKLTGWISYTWSKTERRFDRPLQVINNGRVYPAKNDRRHNISIVCNYEINKRWLASAIFTYYTGNAVTLPSGKYYLEGNAIALISERNGYRMPDYHRLDLSVTWKPQKQKEKWYYDFNFGLFNAYGRKNVFAYNFYEDKNDPGTIKAEKIYLFTWVPSITWNFNF